MPTDQHGNAGPRDRAGRAGSRGGAGSSEGAESVAAAVFVALADPTRRAILAELAARGPATATDLAERLPISRQGVAKHVALLAEAGLVTAEAGERRRVRFRLRSAPMRVAESYLAALARDWDAALTALRHHLDTGRNSP